MNSGHLPMPGSSVFAGGRQCAASIRTRRLSGRLEALDRPDIPQPEAAQVGQFQWPLASDVAQRIAALVAVGFGVRHLAYTHTIQHDPDDARESHYFCTGDMPRAV